MTTGDQIRSARQKAGLTQAELAKRIGVSMRTVGNWERGETPSDRYEARIRQVLGELTPSANAQSIQDYSDAALLAEIARRFDLARSTHAHTYRSEPASPAPPMGGDSEPHGATSAVGPGDMYALADRSVSDGATTYPAEHWKLAASKGPRRMEEADRRAAVVGEESQDPEDWK